MKTSRNFTKPLLLLGAASLLAAVAHTQSRGQQNNSPIWRTLHFQSGAGGGGTTAGSTGGAGGVIVGPTPQPISSVTVSDTSTSDRA